MAPSSLAILLLLLLALTSTFLHPAASLCAPRTDPFHAILGIDFSPSPTVPPVSSPSPTPRTTPSPSPSPSLSPPSGGPFDNVINTVSQVIINSFQDDSLKKVCSTTTYPDECISAIRSVAPNHKNIDPRAALDKIIDVIIINVRAVNQKADKLPAELKHVNTAPAPPTDDPDRAGNPNPLNKCIQGLGDAIKDAESAQLYLQEGNSPGRVRSYLQSFTNSIMDCTEQATPLKDDAVKIYHMIVNGRKIFDSLHPEGSHDALFPEQNVLGDNV